MRNTTKLNHLLLLYELTFSREETLTLTLLNKSTGAVHTFSEENYAKVLQKAYSFMNKELKKNQSETL